MKSVRGDEIQYAFAAWIGILVIAAGVLGIPAGWFLRRWNEKWGWICMVMAPILLIIVAPAMYSDRAVIDSIHFEARYGFWFSPTVHDIRFDDLREIRYVEVRDSKNRVNYELHCVTRSGNTIVVHAGDLLRNAVGDILRKAQEENVPVIDQTRR